MAAIHWIAFFAAIKHEHFDSVYAKFTKYCTGEFIIAKEKAGSAHSETDGEHFHFCCDMSNKNYFNFAKSCFKDDHKLNGKAHDGIPRQYGKVSEIKNLEKMQAYTLKDGCYVSNMDVEKIKELYSKSTPKKEKINIYDKCMNNMKTVPPPGYLRDNWSYISDLKYEVLRTHIKEDVRKDVSKLIMERYIRMFLMYHSDFSEEEKIRLMMQIFLS